MTFTEHLAELRKRLAVSLAVLVATSVLAFSFVEKIADFLILPAGSLSFVYLSPPELFVSYVKLALYTGLALALPVILFELWRFVRPALRGRERRSVFFALLAGGFFFAAGAAFAYFVILPFTIRFFLSYANPRIEAVFSIRDYFDFVTGLAFGFGAAFELPMAAMLLGALGILRAGLLVKMRRYSILGIFIVAAILTPPDIISQVLMAAPLLFLYELSIAILRVQEKKRARRENSLALSDTGDALVQ